MKSNRFFLFGLVLAGLVVSLAAVSAVAAEPEKPEPEHTIWIKINSTPAVVDLYALPEKEGDPLRTRIGTTPCAIAVDLNWKYKWFKKRWDMVSLWSPGNVCRIESGPDDSCEIYLGLVAVKDGYEKGTVDVRVATLAHPGKDWSGTIWWPSEARLELTLTPTGARSSVHPGESRPRARRVIMAEGDGSTDSVSSGALSVSSNVDNGEVFVDDQFVGLTPLQVVLKDGRHVIQVQKTGYYPLRKAIHIDPDTSVSFNAVLSKQP